MAQQYVFLKTCEKPILPLWTVNHGPTTSMYFRDPDGNKIELQVDNFDDVDEANNFMAGPKYDMNPRGTDFDPDEWSEYILSKALPNGEEGLSPTEVKALKTRKDIGERKELPEGFRNGLDQLHISIGSGTLVTSWEKYVSILQRIPVSHPSFSRIPSSASPEPD